MMVDARRDRAVFWRRLSTTTAIVAALHAQSGRLLWRTYSLPDNGGVPGGYAGATMFAPPAVNQAAGLVYGTFGQPYTEPASVPRVMPHTVDSPKSVWQYGAGSSVNAGPAVVRGSVYWGSGYARSGIEGSGNTRLFAFSLDGESGPRPNDDGAQR